MIIRNYMEHEFLQFECVGLKDGGVFPLDNTGRGRDVSPEFVIHNLSSNAKTLVIILEDLSHPIKNFPIGLSGISRQ